MQLFITFTQPNIVLPTIHASLVYHLPFPPPYWHPSGTPSHPQLARAGLTGPGFEKKIWLLSRNSTVPIWHITQLHHIFNTVLKYKGGTGTWIHTCPMDRGKNSAIDFFTPHYLLTTPRSCTHTLTGTDSRSINTLTSCEYWISRPTPPLYISPDPRV